jgi:hypothetical protein
MEAHTRQTIYVPLLDEGTTCCRPVDAESISDCTFRILSENLEPEDEKWEFPSGSIVRCEEREDEEGRILIAVALAEAERSGT